MTESDQERLARLFAELAPDAVVDAYCRLYIAGKIPKEQAEEFLGGAAIMSELISRGLAHPVPHSPTSPASFQAVSPDLALVAIMTGVQAVAAGAHERLVTCYARLAEAQAGAYGSPLRGSRPPYPGDHGPERDRAAVTGLDQQRPAGIPQPGAANHCHAGHRGLHSRPGARAARRRGPGPRYLRSGIR